jgi:hypothetical protein
MPWLHWIGCFFSGAILTNVIPHFVQGISGNPFPTPFAKPPGKGLSSPLVNVLWALFNLLLGAFIFRITRFSRYSDADLAYFFAGVALLAIMSSVSFAKKHKE